MPSGSIVRPWTRSSFAARRLLADRVAVLFATREEGPGGHGLPELWIEGLGVDAARAVVEEAVNTPISAEVLARLLADPVATRWP